MLVTQTGVWRPKPGSILEDGSVVDYRGEVCRSGQCFVPDDFGCGKGWDKQLPRRTAYSAAGWTYAPARRWPSMMPISGTVCVERR